MKRSRKGMIFKLIIAVILVSSLLFMAACSETIATINEIPVTQAEVDEWHQYLVDAAVKVKRPPQYTTAFKIYNGFYLDPIGYTIEIQAFDPDAQPNGAEAVK